MRQGLPLPGQTGDTVKPATAQQVKDALVATGLPQFAGDDAFPPFKEGGADFDGSQGSAFPFDQKMELSGLPAGDVLDENPDTVGLSTIEDNPLYDHFLETVSTDGEFHTDGIEVGTNGQNKAGVNGIIRENKCITRDMITRYIEGFKCKLDDNLCKLLFGRCIDKIAGAFNVDDISGLSDSGKSILKSGDCKLPLKDWNAIFGTHLGRKNNGQDNAKNGRGSHKGSIFKAMGGTDGFGANEGFGGKLRGSDGKFICAKSRDLRGSRSKIRNFAKKLGKELKKIIGKYLKQLDEKCPKKKIKDGDRRRQPDRLGAGNPVNNNGNPDRKNRKQGKKTKKPVRRKSPGLSPKQASRWRFIGEALAGLRRRSRSNIGNINIYKNLSFFEGTNFTLVEEAINDIPTKTDDEILDNFQNNLLAEALMPGSTFSAKEPEPYAIETVLLVTDNFNIYLLLTLGDDYGLSETFNKVMDHYHSQMKLAVALWNETVADSFPEAVIGRGIGLFAKSMSLQPYIHAYPAPPPLNFLLPDGVAMAPNQFGLMVTMDALQDEVDLSFTSSELSAFRGLVRLLTRWTKAFARNYEVLMGSTARIFVPDIDPVPTAVTSLPTPLTNLNNFSDDTEIRITSELVEDTARVVIEYTADFGDAYAGTVNGGLTGLDVESWGKPDSSIIGSLQNLVVDDFNLSTTDRINSAVFNDREALTKGITIDEDYRLDNWLVNLPPYSDTNPPKFSFTITLNFDTSVPYDSNYTPGVTGPSVGEALREYILLVLKPYIDDIKAKAKQTQVGAHIIWPTNYPLPTDDQLKALINNDGTSAKPSDFNTIVLPGSTNILILPKSPSLSHADADPLLPTVDVHTGAAPMVEHTTNQYGALIAPTAGVATPTGAIPVAIGSVFPEGITTSKMMDIIDLNFNVLYSWLGDAYQNGAPGAMKLSRITAVNEAPGTLTTVETDSTGSPLECKRPVVTTALLPNDSYLPGDMGFSIVLSDKDNTVGFLPLQPFQISPRNIATGFTADEAARPPIMGLNNTTFVTDGSGLGGGLSTVLENVINTVNKLVFNKRCAETQLTSVTVSDSTEEIEINWPITFDSVPNIAPTPFTATVGETNKLFTLQPYCLTTTGGKFSVLDDTTETFDTPVVVPVAVTGMTIPQNYKDNIILDQGVKTEGVCGSPHRQSGLTTARTTQLTISELALLVEESRSF